MHDPKPVPNPVSEAARRHGGDLAEVAEKSAFSGAWLDVSTGINPWPYPLGATPPALAARLPDASLLARLRLAAARYYGAPGPDCVVPGPGSQSLIQLLPRLVAPARVAVLSPTYNEHAPAWRLAGHEVVDVPSLEALDAARVSILVATNPNNPDGKRLERARLLDLAAAFGARGGRLVIDEAFADTMPELSLANEAARPGLVVLRSFGKFFGLAGLRLGFAIAEPAFASRIAASLGPWPVSGPAAWIAARAFADTEWIASTRQFLAAAATRLDALLRAGGLDILGGTSLYRLAASPHARAIDAALRVHGIYARSFPERPQWLRFGLLPDAAAEARLASALASVANATSSLIETEVSR